MAAMICLSIASGLQASTEDCRLPRQTGPIVLRIEIGNGASPRRLALDRAGLQAMPQDEFETSTIWTEGPQHFRGVRLWRLVRCLGVQEGLITLTAKNGYLADIPVKDLRPDGALIRGHR
jgi:hypothetical protein